MHWLVYFLLITILGVVTYHCWEWIALRRLRATTSVDIVSAVVLAAYVQCFVRNPFIASFLVLAVPAKISLSRRRFMPVMSYGAVHAEFQAEYLTSTDRLRMLDVATGSCNSLFRHGWMNLNAEYTAVDISETMLNQGMRLMASNGVPVDFLLCDAARLPFETETFDIVTSYGAVNAYANPKKALEEMVRVTKKRGKILFMDEQAYQAASRLERAYFKGVLTAHNAIDRCPVDMLPAQLEDVRVHQVYEFVYICTARKGGEIAITADI